MSGRLRIGSACTGYGGLDMAVQAVLGGELAWVADLDPGAAAVLAHHWPDVPNLGDITAVDWPAVERVDVFAAGFPCQDISNAGKRAGIDGSRSGIWRNVADAIRVLRPRLVLLENVAALIARGLDRVTADLAAFGYVGSWCCICASDVGAPHRRERLFILATVQDADGAARGEWRLTASGQEEGGRARADAGRRGGAPAAHSGRPRLEVREVQPDGPQCQAVERGCREQAWGVYAPAIARWERMLGRPAPMPTEPGRTGERLSPRFVEWLMGLPAGHVADVPGLSRNQMLKLLGNGVVWQQGAAALSLLLDRRAAA